MYQIYCWATEAAALVREYVRATKLEGLSAVLSKFLARTLAIVLAGLFAMALVPMAAQAQEMRIDGGALSTEIIDGANVPNINDHTQFDPTPINISSNRTYYIVNEDIVPANSLTIGTVTITFLSGPAGNPFGVNTLPAATVAGGGAGWTPLGITFAPTVTGTYRAEVSIVNNDSNENPYTFEIEGTGTQLPAEINVVGILDGDTTPSVGENTDYGQQAVGVAASRAFQIENLGTADLILTGNPTISITGSTDFAVITPPATNTAIVGGGQTGITIQFTPTSTGVKNATISIANNDSDENPYTFAIAGIGAAVPEMDVTFTNNGNPVNDGATFIESYAGNGTDFGSIVVGLGLNTNYTIRNNGTADLNIGAISTGSPDFVVMVSGDPSNTTITAGNQSTLQIRFNPNAARLGVQSATVTIPNNDPNEAPYDFVVQGNAIAAPTEIRVVGNGTDIWHNSTNPLLSDGTDFGTNTVLSVTDRNFEVQNVGGADLNLTGTPDRVTLSGTHAADFEVTVQPGATVVNGTPNGFTIRFIPSATGLRQATVSIPNDDSDEAPFVFAIQGTGSNTPPEISIEGNNQPVVDGTLSVSAGNLTDFGTQVAGGNYPATFRIFNTGLDTLTLSTITASSNDGNFTLPGLSVPIDILGGGFYDLVVQFSPYVSGNVTIGTVTINNNDMTGGEATYTFAIEGTASGPDVAFSYQGQAINDEDTGTSPTNGTDFGSQTVGSTTDITYDITNTGDTSLSIGTLTFSTGNWNDYTLISTPGPIAPGNTGTITIRFTPGGAGARPTNFSIVTNDADENPYNFNITGTGVAAGPEIAVEGNNTDITDGDSSPSLGDHTAFGSANVTGGLVSRVFTIRNTGFAILNVSSIVLGGADVADFTIVGSVPTTVAANNGTETFTVEFDPTTAGNKAASITINSDDSDEAIFDFAISGVGTIPEIEVRGDGIIISSGDFAPQLLDRTDFDSQTMGSNTTYYYSVFNLGSGDLNITGPVTISGTDPGDFTVILQPVSPITANTALGIRFNPQALGLRTAIVTIPNDDSDENPYQFAIQGTGTAAPAPEIEVSGNALNIVDGATSPSAADHTDFGATDIIGGLISRTFTIDNTGTNTLDIIGVSMSGPDAANFNVTQSPASTLAAGNSTTFVVQFDPSTVGIKDATITIQNSDADEASFDFAIQGEGTSSGQGSITIIQKISGPDRSVSFTSTTNALNMSLTTTGGTAQSDAIIVGAGIHTITAADLSGAGYGISAIYCDDTNSSGDVDSRIATINVSLAETVTCIFETVATREITSAMIRDFLGSRNLILMNSQPDISRRLTRLNPVSGPRQSTANASAFGFTARIPSPIDVQISQNLLSFAASSSSIMGEPDAAYPDISNWDIWTEGNITLFDSNAGQNGTTGVVHAGVDYLATKDILVGLRAQVDWMSQEFSTTSGSIKGTGWMVGPYAIVRLGENFYFDVSSTWGTSLNYISPFGTYVDEFSTTRWLIDGSLVGEFKVENWTIRPTASFTYINEYQNAYSDSLNVPILGQNVANGEIRVGPRVSYTNNLENGSQLIPWVELFGVYNFTSTPATSANSFSSAMQGFTGSVEAGLDLTAFEGGIINIAGQYEGIGSGAQAFGVTLGLSAPLN